MKFDAEEFALPITVKVGGGYEREVAAIDGRVLATLDLVFPNDGDVREHVGAEYSYRHMLSLRAGYKGLGLLGESYDTQGATFGAGVEWRDVTLDYAFLPSEKLGDNHRFALGFSF
jgi:hypothetical protein